MLILSAGVTQTVIAPAADNVALLLSFDGSDGAITTTDSSVYEHTITRNGNVTLEDTQKKFGTTASYFSARYDYWSAPASVAFEMADNDFTVECWVYLTAALTSTQEIITFVSADTYKKYFYILGGGGISARIFFFDQNGSIALNSTVGQTLIPTATWTHLAWCRKDGDLYMYIGGERLVVSAVPTWGTGVRVEVGCNTFYNKAVYYDELRVINGTAMYVDEYIEVPTEAFPVPTTLPFEDEEAVMYYKFNGTQGSTTFTDESTYSRALTIVGGTTVELDTSVYKFGTASLHIVDGAASAKITTPWTEELEFIGDTTLQLHVRFATLADCILLSTKPSGVNKGWRLQYSHSSTNLQFETNISSGATPISLQSGSSVFAANTWYHIEITRFGNRFYMFIDGVLITTDTDDRYEYDDTQSTVGWFAGGGDFYIDGLRMTHDGIPHIANFTPPTAEY